METTQSVSATDEWPIFLDEEDEEDALTIRREFSPKSPRRVEVEVSDADATWKWTSARADHANQFVGLALPTLEGAQALEFERDDVEATLEWARPFALSSPNAAAIPLVPRPRRRPLPRLPDSTAEIMALMQPPERFWHSRPKLLALGAVLAVLAFAIGYFTHKRPTTYVVGVAMASSR